MACVWLTLIMTCNKALYTVSYTKNSITEKVLLSAIDRTKFEIGLNGIAKNTDDTEEGDDG